MALFFSTSRHDGLCRSLGLPNFALSATELERQAKSLDLGTDGQTLARTVSAINVAYRARRQSVVSGQAGEEELRASALPLVLLRDGPDADAAREEAGLPQLPPAAPPETDAAREAPAVGLVHAKLCEFSQSGALPLQDGAPDIPSAGFHLVCAAAASEPRALRDVRALLLGLAADELLAGVRLRDADVGPAAAELLTGVTRRLAAAGEVSAMAEAADASAAAGDAAGGAAWLRTAVARAEETPAQAVGACALHRLLTRLAELHVESGDRERAAADFEAAAEAANEAGNFKLGMKLAERAAALAPDDGE